MPSVASDERQKAIKFFMGLNARYREVMGRNPPTTYITAVEEPRGMETQFQLGVERAQDFELENLRAVP